MASEQRNVTVEQRVTVYLCDHCGAELPPTQGYASGKRVAAVEVHATRYSAGGKPSWVWDRLYDPPLLCEPCVNELTVWLGMEGT